MVSDQITHASRPTVADVGQPGRRAHWRSVPAMAGIAYALSWIVGLVVWPTNLGIGSSDLTVAADYRANAGHAVVQYLLIEGVAGVFLAVVIGSLVLPTRNRPSSVALRAAVIAGLVAAALSVTLFVIGLVIVRDASHHHVTSAGNAFDLVNRLDGFKMLLLAIAALGVAAGSSRGALPRWLILAGYVLAATLIVSGISYGLLASGLAWTVYVSGPLLVLWIPSIGYATSGDSQ
jgi:hypothetical protein